MDLIHNQTFRVMTDSLCPAGIYRVILVEPAIQRIVVARIHSTSDEAPSRHERGGRPRVEDRSLLSPRKKPPQPMVGELIWLVMDELNNLIAEYGAAPVKLDRLPITGHSEAARTTLARRIEIMAPALDFEHMRQMILMHKGVGGLAREIMDLHSVSRTHVYKLWSCLCRWGFHDSSLIPLNYKCGAPGVARPCSQKGPEGTTRKKAGRKTLKQRTACRYGVELDPEQPGMTAEWTAAVRAADRQIPEPKPRWRKRHKLIVMSSFCGKAYAQGDKVELVMPDPGTYPNLQQTKRALTVDKSRLEQVMELTTKRHFKSALRGLVARNWKGVAGPGHTWAIDSTVADMYLRSSVNRAWIVGRPIVYVIVDVWSTAVTGFYVCLTGPSWATAKVALFNSTSDPSLVADLWGYTPMLSLSPSPTICHDLLCDRGEYLSQGASETALKLLGAASYAPPYRGDLKGVVEVLHRIEKDAQFLFVPGAMDYRRKELDLRRIDPSTCVLTVREYTQYLYEVFSEYNLTADRSHRIDATMRADEVFPSPAGLWAWGHAVGIGFRKHVDQSQLIDLLLPSSTGRVARDGVRHAGNYYTSEETQAAQWTTRARNLGGWDIPVHHYPGSMSTIWTPQADGADLWRLGLTDESRALPENTVEEWADVLAEATMKRAGESHERMAQSIRIHQRMKKLLDYAKRETQIAVAAAKGPRPSMTEARQVEVAAAHPTRSEEGALEALRDEALEEHSALLEALLRAEQ